MKPLLTILNFFFVAYLPFRFTPPPHAFLPGRAWGLTRLQFAVSELTDPTGRKAYNLTSKPNAKDFYVGPFD